MKRIVIDARSIGETPHGIAMYVEGIARTLLENPSWKSTKEFIFLIGPDCPQDSVVRKFETVLCQSSVFGIAEWFEIPKVLKRLKPDLFHNPSFVSFPYLPCPYIQTVHDLNHLMFGRLHHHLYYFLLLKPSIRKAQKVFTVSEFIKKDLILWTGLPAEHFSISYNRIDAMAGSNPLSEAYFFCVSNPKWHKNLSMLFRAYTEYKKRLGAEALPLWVTIQNFDEVIPEGIALTGGVSGSRLESLYAGARAFVFPSLYEGFGRPPVEAALIGVPVGVSDIPPHREGLISFQDSIQFLDPNRIEPWTEYFVKMTREPKSIRTPKESPFSGEKLVSTYLRMYD